MNKTNNQWYPYEQVGSYYKLVDGVLMFSPMNADGSRDTEEGEVEFDALTLETGEYEKDGKKLALVEYLRSIEEELKSLE